MSHSQVDLSVALIAYDIKIIFLSNFITKLENFLYCSSINFKNIIIIVIIIIIIIIIKVNKRTYDF